MNYNFIKEIVASQRETWNEAVKKVNLYDVFYMNEYVTAFMNESVENGEPILLVYENGNDYAINVVFKRDISKAKEFDGVIENDKYFDLISPYGYGGFIGQVSNYKELNAAYKAYCTSNHYICEFVRFELESPYIKNYDGEVLTKTHNVIRTLNQPIEDIWMDFKQKVRKNVKRADKNNLEIIIDESGCLLDDFLSIYYKTMDRTNAEKDYYFSKEFFKCLNEMVGHYSYFHVKYEGKIISTEMVIYGTDTCYSYLGGTDSEYFELRPNDFLKYEIIKWAKNKGLSKFVLGGGYGKDDGIFQYKTCLAPNGIVDFYIGKRIFEEDMYNELVKIRELNGDKPINEEFFPIYRS